MRCYANQLPSELKKGLKPFYRRGISKQHQNLGAIQNNTV